MPQNKEHNKKIKLDDKTIEKGFIKVAEDIALLKNCLTKTIEEINKIKGFQYVVTNILDECEIISRDELNRLTDNRYSSAMADEIRRFLNKKLPGLDKEIDLSIKAMDDLGRTFEQFETEYFDEDGNPKAKA